MASVTSYTPDQLLVKAAEFVEQCHYDIGAKFYLRALEMNPKDTNIMDALADAHLQLDQVDEALLLLEKSVSLAPSSGPAKWLSLAQLKQGQDAAACYGQGILLLTQEENSSKQHTDALASAHCSVVELYMTDLCDTEDAEQICETNLATALQLNPDGFEPNTMAASLRLVQQRRDEAVVHVNKMIAAVNKEQTQHEGEAIDTDEFSLPLR
jgi:tetratricopeptide (TPR) repeat protein